MSEVNKEVIDDDTLEIIFTDIKQLRKEVERNRAVTELTQEIVNGLIEEIKILKKKFEV